MSGLFNLPAYTGQPWYTYTVTSDYAQSGGGSSYQNTDVLTPLDTPITASLPGVITFVGYEPWGGQVNWKLDQPILGIPYAFVIHLDSINPDLAVGQHIEAGTFLGYSGGETSTAGLSPLASGLSHHATDSSHSTGPHLDIGVTASSGGSIDASQAASNQLVAIALANQVAYGTAILAGGPAVTCQSAKAGSCQQCQGGIPLQCPNNQTCVVFNTDGTVYDAPLSPGLANGVCVDQTYRNAHLTAPTMFSPCSATNLPDWICTPDWGRVLEVVGGVIILGIALVGLFWPQAQQVITTVAKSAEVAAV